jgi:NADH dehydrogenase FAD-containing subunit
MKRRHLLGSLSALGWPWPVGAQALASSPTPQTATRQRVVVLGGGWAGLSFTRELRRLAPHIDIVLLDREPVLRSLPLSNPWLVGRTPERLPGIDLAALGTTLGFRFVQAEALEIDRTQRQVQTSQGTFA